MVHLLSNMESVENSTELASKINVLDTITFILAATNEVENYKVVLRKANL